MGGPTDNTDAETVEARRVPLTETSVHSSNAPGAELSATLASAQTTVASGPSVTRELRAHQGRRRRRLPTDDVLAVPSVRPAADAIFPALVSLLFVGPYAVHLWRDGRPLHAALATVATFALTFAFFVWFSRRLDRRIR